MAQLQLIQNDYLAQIESLNEELVSLLVSRDELVMEQDAMLTDIEDLSEFTNLKKWSNIKWKPLFKPQAVIDIWNKYFQEAIFSLTRLVTMRSQPKYFQVDCCFCYSFCFDLVVVDVIDVNVGHRSLYLKFGQNWVNSKWYVVVVVVIVLVLPSSAQAQG